MKKTFLIGCLLISTLHAAAQDKQDKLISVNGTYMTDSEIWGASVQMMLPVGNNFYVAPDVAYYFPKTFLEFAGTKIQASGFNFNVDVHYALRLGNERSFISPLAGIGGFVAWAEAKGNSYNATSSDFTFLANIGLAGRFNLGNNFYTSPQIKYMIPFKDGSDGEFVISAGFGLYF